MFGKKKDFTWKHFTSGAVMLILLAWLTVCLPYVNESHQSAKNQIEQPAEENGEIKSSNPLTNTNEEKGEGGISLPSEYLHSPYALVHSFEEIAALHKLHPSDLYQAYHPDMIIPPPEL